MTRFQQYFATESASGVVLMACTVIALVWANSPWAESYHALWHTKLTIGVPALTLSLDLHHWINDGLMALFFFVVGLEIKRELLVGELSQLRQALLPIFGALGGMVVPALIYVALNHGGAVHGWGVPVATDIAFALAVLTLVGPRLPTGLKVFLVALAIVDDLGAVVVIALFYTTQLNLPALGIAAAGLVLAALLNWRGVHRPLPYALVGVVVWLAILLSGVHATVAGVLLALCIPVRSRIDVQAFYKKARRLLRSLEETFGNGSAGQLEGAAPAPATAASGLRLSNAQQELVGEIERACEYVQPPLDRLEHGLHPWIAFCIMPLFALSNAGVHLPAQPAALLEPVSLGVLLGLVLGKQLGVASFVWLAVRLRLAVLPAGVTWQHIYGAAWVCGVGFTMSLFIANLAFRDAAQLDAAKLGILAASAIAGTVGYLLLKRSCRPGSSPADGPSLYSPAA